MPLSITTLAVAGGGSLSVSGHPWANASPGQLLRWMALNAAFFLLVGLNAIDYVRTEDRITVEQATLASKLPASKSPEPARAVPEKPREPQPQRVPTAAVSKRPAQAKRTPAPKRAERPPAVETASRTAPAPPPKPPATPRAESAEAPPATVTLKPLGYIEWAGGTVAAVIVEGGWLRIVQIGDELANGFRVAGISESAIKAVKTSPASPAASEAMPPPVLAEAQVELPIVAQEMPSPADQGVAPEPHVAARAGGFIKAQVPEGTLVWRASLGEGGFPSRMEFANAGEPIGFVETADGALLLAFAAGGDTHLVAIREAPGRETGILLASDLTSGPGAGNEEGKTPARFAPFLPGMPAELPIEFLRSPFPAIKGQGLQVTLEEDSSGMPPDPESNAPRGRDSRGFHLRTPERLPDNRNVP